MLLHPRSKDRPFHLGPFPLELLPRDEGVIALEAGRVAIPMMPSAIRRSDDVLLRAADHYREMFSKFAEGAPVNAKAPVPDDLERRSVDIKGGAYFMDASCAGICRVPEAAWMTGAAKLPHEFALVVMVEHPRCPEADNLAHEWTRASVEATADMRAAEIACCLAEHVRHMGFAARAHVAGDALLDVERLAVLAGLVVRRGEAIENPYIGKRFSLAAVSADYALAIDLPLRADALDAAKGTARRLAYWWGINGAQSGRERNRRARRATHLSSYPMETVKRVERPTTLIIDDEVPQVPKRAAFFQRALHGDLGEKAKKERTRFAFKTPFSFALLQLIRSMVKFQDGEAARAEAGRLGDPSANALAIKSLSYFLGSDLTGICEIPRYAWFSHKEDGSPIEPYHRYAVVMLIDQGYDTMEGASGDDWISGAQSMRGYLRGAEIAGIMSEFLRAKGFSARSQTNADSDVLHIPLILWAGLGELSRIGELVLNPFVGPRFQVGGSDHGCAAGSRQADRFRIADFLRQLPQMRARMPVRRDPVRRQDHVQRVRNLETGRRALHALSVDQSEGLRVRPLHEDVPAEQGRGRRWRAADADGELARRQCHVAEAAHGADRDVPRRLAEERKAQSCEEMVVRS